MSHRTEVEEFLSYPKPARDAALSLLREHAALLGESSALPSSQPHRSPARHVARAQASNPTRVAQKKGPETDHDSSGPADATNVTPDPDRDTLGVPKPRQGCNTPAPFNPILCCPLCKRFLAEDGSCMPCKAQFVNIDADVAERVNFAPPPEGADEFVLQPAEVQIA